jgi:hypothetical protein
VSTSSCILASNSSMNSAERPQGDPFTSSSSRDSWICSALVPEDGRCGHTSYHTRCDASPWHPNGKERRGLAHRVWIQGVTGPAPFAVRLCGRGSGGSFRGRHYVRADWGADGSPYEAARISRQGCGPSSHACSRRGDARSFRAHRTRLGEPRSALSLVYWITGARWTISSHEAIVASFRVWIEPRHLRLPHNQ